MTPEVAAHLAKATEDPADARAILAIPLPKAASRGAYHAAFQATEALLPARTGRIAKTRTGLRSTLAKRVHGASGDERALLTFLARAYK